MCLWKKGRQLKSFDNITYTYNANGIRTSKAVDGVTHTYTLDGTKILREVWGTHNGDYFVAEGIIEDYVDGTDIDLYYLQSRYYDAEIGRFINADSVIYSGFGDSEIAYNLLCYCQNNTANYVDYNGLMAVMVLRIISSIYNECIINDSELSLSVLALNGLGIYLAFHEIAQLNIAKKLKSLGFFDIFLEQHIKGKGEADIVATKGKKYVWEVKALGKNPNLQLTKYTSGTGYCRGYNIGSISNISICGNVKMNITFDSSGGAFYTFYVGGRRVTNAQLYKAFKNVIVAACAVSATIILGTIVEDIITCGVGIWNDGPSLVGAAASMVPIIISGFRAYGYA